MCHGRGSGPYVLTVVIKHGVVQLRIDPDNTFPLSIGYTHFILDGQLERLTDCHIDSP